jgi:hypothetical protein
MYDPFSQGIMEDLPDLSGLTPEGVRRVLSRTYFEIENLRLRGPSRAEGTIVEDARFLRRLSNTLESRAVFDHGVVWGQRQASAFVAAEALALVADLESIAAEDAMPGARLESPAVFSRVESSLLYLLAGYDANAGGVVSSIPEAAEVSVEGHGRYRRSQVLAAEWALETVLKLCSCRLNPLPEHTCPVDFIAETPETPSDLYWDVRGRLFAELGTGVSDYVRWLAGDSTNGLLTATDRLGWLAGRLAESKEDWRGTRTSKHPASADIHHLARLLLATLDSSSERALVAIVPPPSDGDPDRYRAYLRARARGTRGAVGRALVWPSVQRYIEECLPGPRRHAVVSMPTGSGKSFLAEIAISQALESGWTLYLVPTNALAHQARADLRLDLQSLGAEVRA